MNKHLFSWSTQKVHESSLSGALVSKYMFKGNATKVCRPGR